MIKIVLILFCVFFFQSLCFADVSVANKRDSKKVSQQEAIVALTRQVDMLTVIDLIGSQITSEDKQFLLAVYKKNNSLQNKKLPFGINRAGELTVNGKVAIIGKNSLIYNKQTISYNKNRSLQFNVVNIAKQLRRKSFSVFKIFFIQDAMAQEIPEPTGEELQEAASLAMAFTYMPEYTERHNGAYRLKADMGQSIDIQMALRDSKRTVESVRCVPGGTGETTMYIHFKGGSQMEFHKLIDTQTGGQYFGLINYNASGEKSQLKITKQTTLNHAISAFCDYPEDVRNEYARGLQDIQLRNADSGAGTVGH